jgi:hypothetical protein
LTHHNGAQPPPPPPPHPWHPNPAKLVRWIRWRAGVPHLPRDHAHNQRRSSLILLTFGAARIAAWTILGVCVILGLAHAGGFHWAKLLAESIPFVVLISIYANWATDLDAATAAFAALVAADSHVASDANRQLLTKDFTALEDDIARLALMNPCPEADDLATSIRTRLSAAAGQNAPGETAAQRAEKARAANAAAEIATAQERNAPGGGD